MASTSANRVHRKNVIAKLQKANFSRTSVAKPEPTPRRTRMRSFAIFPCRGPDDWQVSLDPNCELSVKQRTAAPSRIISVLRYLHDGIGSDAADTAPRF